MEDSIFTADEENLLKANAKYGLIGLAVGIIISTFSTIYDSHGISGKHVFINILFSIAITLSITNSVYLYERYLNRREIGFWKYVAGFYLCNMTGMVVGTEWSHELICLVYNIPYRFNDNIVDYKFNFFVVIVVGSLLLVYQAQKTSMRAQLKSKELDLAKAGKLRLQAELQTLQAKINPHFLYNSLNSIASLIHEAPDTAEDMTLKLSKLFRYSINTMQESFSTVNEEVEILNTYLDIEKIRFGKRINFKIIIDKGLENTAIPRFLIQPLVENALKHGLKDVAGNGLLTVRIEDAINAIEITVADNGVSFPEELQIGYGLQSIYDKLELLYQHGYEIKIRNDPAKCIKIILPVKK
jgi:two-component system LytT family sensor kinase